MKISYQWLKTLLNFKQTPREVAELLTDVGLEVAAQFDYEVLPEGLIIGEVITVNDHPNADKLKSVKVDIGGAMPLSIVCGDLSLSKGKKVVVALIGTEVRHPNGKPLKIKRAKIRGEYSEGMLCSEAEIGISDA